MRKIGIDERTIDLFLKFHYADGTKDGSGNVRLSSDSYKQLYQNDIDEINNAFNDNGEILKKAIEHFMIVGRYNDNVEVLIHGTIDDFFWITKDEMFKIMLAKKDN